MLIIAKVLLIIMAVFGGAVSGYATGAEKGKSYIHFFAVTALAFGLTAAFV